jgi:8-oxo-dGTP pyrophosphatase MutT (NUDIX family)
MHRMDFQKFIGELDNRLQGVLPGRASQLKMSSMARIQELVDRIPADDAVQSSVLVLLYPLDGDAGLVLIQRPDYRGVHGGQISLPGGKYEDGDESLVFTALREAREEIGVNPGTLQVIGRLTEMYIPPSNFMVTPVVAYSARQPKFIPDPKEVAGIIEIRLSQLMDERNRTVKKMKLRYGFSLKVPCYFIDGHVIWGATAMMLSEFREIAAGILDSADA